MRQFTGQADKLGDNHAMPSCQVACPAVNAGRGAVAMASRRSAMRSRPGCCGLAPRNGCRFDAVEPGPVNPGWQVDKLARQGLGGTAARWTGGLVDWWTGGLADWRTDGLRASGAGRRLGARRSGHTGAGIRAPAYGRRHTGTGIRAPAQALARTMPGVEAGAAPAPRCQRIAIGLSRAASIKAPSSSDTSSWVKDNSASLSPSCR